MVLQVVMRLAGSLCRDSILKLLFLEHHHLGPVVKHLLPYPMLHKKIIFAPRALELDVAHARIHNVVSLQLVPCKNPTVWLHWDKRNLA